MEVKFYNNFSKRINSTKQPSGSPAWTASGVLRSPCSVENPVIEFKNMGNTAPVGYSYAQISKFSRYYFVSDWKYEDGLWVCYLTEDVLGSWKTNIGTTSAYIERAVSQSDGNIIDTLYPTETNTSIVNTNLASSWNSVAVSGGCFVIGVIGSASAYSGTSKVGGAVTYYALSMSDMISLLSYLLSSGFLNDNGFPQQMTTTQQLTQEVAKAFTNPTQYISSCMWFPFAKTQLSDGVDRSIQIGYYDVGSNHATGQYVTAITFTTYVTGEIPVHPQSSTRGEFLNYTNNSEHILTVEPFGSFVIDNAYLRNGRYLKCPVVIDPVTGKATIRIMVQSDANALPNNCIIREASALFGVPIQLAQVTSDFIGAGADLVRGGAMLGVATSSAGEGLVPYGSVKPPIGMGDMGLLMSMPSIGNAIKDVAGRVETKGVNGSFLMTSPALTPCLTSIFKPLVDENLTECGRPLCQVKTINTLSGFIKCGEVTIDYPCYDNEKSTIHHHMLNGFFWE